METWNYYKWPLDRQGQRKSIKDFSDFEKVRYQVYMAKVECTVDNHRNINEEILYLMNWYFYFEVLCRNGHFDCSSMNYLHHEIVRLHKERVGWH